MSCQNRPNYKKIYTDIIKVKYPEKLKECEALLNKDYLSIDEIWKLQEKIFGNISGTYTEKFNQQHRSYTKLDIMQILAYQKNNMLNNSQLARHFKISRNTITKWKKIMG